MNDVRRYPMDPPEPYKRRDGGGILVQTMDRKGATRDSLIYEYDLYPIRRIRVTSDRGEAIVWRVHLPRDGVREFQIPLPIPRTLKTILRRISSQGVYASVSCANALSAYVAKYSVAFAERVDVGSTTDRP